MRTRAPERSAGVAIRTPFTQIIETRQAKDKKVPIPGFFELRSALFSALSRP
jgi:hypothetical protein